MRKSSLLYTLPLLGGLLGIYLWLNRERISPERENFSLLLVKRYDSIKMKEVKDLKRKLLLSSREGEREKADKYKEKIKEVIYSIVEAYQNFLSRYPDSKEAWNLLGLVYFDHMSEQEKAKECWEKALEIDPSYSPALNNLATYYAHIGEHIQSIKLLQKAISVNPHNAIFHLNLSDSYLLYRYKVMKEFGWSLPRVFHEAMKEAEIARELEPNNFWYAIQVAELQYQARFFKIEPDWEKALKDLEYCKGLPLNDKEKMRLYLDFYRVYWNLGRKEEAREALLTAYKILPSHHLKNLLERLKNNGKDKTP